MTIYALFICTIYAKAAILSTCDPTPFMNDRTAEICEMHRQYMLSVRPDITTPEMKMKAICMKRTVATWSPVEVPAQKPKPPIARKPVQIVAAEPIYPSASPAETPNQDKELMLIDKIYRYWIDRHEAGLNE